MTAANFSDYIPGRGAKAEQYLYRPERAFLCTPSSSLRCPVAVPIIDLVQKIHGVADRLRQSDEHRPEADLLDDIANQIVDVFTHELSARERQIYEYERRLGNPVDPTSPSDWTNISEL